MKRGTRKKIKKKQKRGKKKQNKNKPKMMCVGGRVQDAKAKTITCW